MDYFAKAEPRLASSVRSSISPNIIQGGYRINVIPSEAKASLDVRLISGQDPEAFLNEVRKVVNDPAIRVEWIPRDVRPATPSARLDSEVFKVLESAYARLYDTAVLPTMSTGATDMAYLRAKGIQCYGVGPAARHRRRAEGVRRAQRSGTYSRKRAAQVRAFPLRGRARSRPCAVKYVRYSRRARTASGTCCVGTCCRGRRR